MLQLSGYIGLRLERKTGDLRAVVCSQVVCVRKVLIVVVVESVCLLGVVFMP